VGSFDCLDHDLLISTLRERIHDGRFIHLLRKLLDAGYLEDWQFNQTLSGVPQGSIVSPILSNILLDQLDKFVGTVLIPQYTRGAKRKASVAYGKLNNRAQDLFKKGQSKQAQQVRKQAQHLPAGDPDDPDFRRLRYVRYADDVRHLTHCLIPLGERRSSEETTSGSLDQPECES
jgi:retron-type reverse transcriptase